METLFLKRHEDRRLRAGHLWIFSNEVDVKRSPLTAFAPGQAAHVADADGRPLGTAYVNPASLIAARLVSRKPNRPLDADMLRERLRTALGLRERLFARPCYRLCHGEGDFLPGLVIDRHGDHVVIQISTAGMDIHTPALLDIVADLLRPASIVLDNDLAARDLEGLARSVTMPLGDAPDEAVIVENDLEYVIPLRGGQKTGWFYDQRENRAAVAPFAAGASVLDVFCYAGGFGALAARHGAASVAFADASAPALAFADRNARAAGLRGEPEIMKGDALEILAELRRDKRRFNMVCLDPPAFIKRRKDAKEGIEAYRRANDLALALVAPGGVLLTCSCSHHLEADTLQGLAAKAAARQGRSARLLRRGFQGPDHPVHPSMPETAYLKAFLFHLAN